QTEAIALGEFFAGFGPLVGVLRAILRKNLDVLFPAIGQLEGELGLLELGTTLLGKRAGRSGLALAPGPQAEAIALGKLGAGDGPFALVAPTILEEMRVLLVPMQAARIGFVPVEARLLQGG